MAALMGVETDASLPAFKDTDTLPVWAEGAVAAMCAAGIFDGEAEVIGGADELTKIECAAYLYEMYKLINE